MAKKKGKQANKAQKHKEAQEKAEAEAEAKKKADEAAAEEAKKAKEAKKLANQKYRASVKELVALCVENMPGTKYDKFYVDELIKKYPKQEDIDELISKIKEIAAGGNSGQDFIDKFLELVESEADRKKRLEDEDSERRKKELEVAR